MAVATGGMCIACVFPSITCPRAISCATIASKQASPTLKMVKRAEAAKPTEERPDMDKLFPDKAMRGRDAQAESYDGRLIARKMPDRHGDVPNICIWGTVAYRGADMRPLYFLVRYDDDTEEILSLTTLRKRNPMPHGSV